MKRGFVLFAYMLLLAAAGGGGFLNAQRVSPREVLDRLSQRVELDPLFKNEPALTTSLADALTGVPFLDGFAPQGFEPLSLQPRGAGGAFRVDRGGLYGFRAESYCLHAGTRAPGQGDGYALAPLKGPRAAIIRNILFRASDHHEIPQEDIQVLVWAVLARSRIDLDSAGLLETAVALLTPKEILEVNGGALGLLSGIVLEKTLPRIPPAFRDAFKAEAELRNALSRADATYEELEGIAVLADETENSGTEADGDGALVPRGRWSYNPRGYFVRFFPQGYAKTVVEIYKPEAFAVERDALGRVTAIAHPEGERIELAYGEGAKATAAPGDPDVQAWPVTAIRLACVYPKGVGRIVEAECADPGWTLAGVPGAKGRELPEREGFPGFAARHQGSRKQRVQMQTLLDGLKKSGLKIKGGFGEEQWARIMGLYHAIEVLKQAAAGDKLECPGWMTDPLELAYRAWQSELAVMLGASVGRTTGISDETELGKGPCLPLFLAGGAESEGGGFDEIDLTPDGGQPGDPGEQREGISNRGDPDDEKCDGEYKGCKLVAGSDLLGCSAECMGVSETLSPQQRECLVECTRKLRQDQKDCQTIIRNCKGL